MNFKDHGFSFCQLFVESKYRTTKVRKLKNVKNEVETTESDIIDYKRNILTNKHEMCPYLLIIQIY